MRRFKTFFLICFTWICCIFPLNFISAANDPLEDIKLLVEENKLDDAMDIISDLCLNDPGSLSCGEALLLKTQIHFRKMQMDDGLRVYDEVISIGNELNNDPLLQRAYGGKGEILFMRGRYEEGMKTYKKFLTVFDPDDQVSYSGALTQIGNCHRFLGNLDSAENYIEKAREIKIAIDDQKGLPMVYVSLAAIATRRGYAEEAISLNLKAIEVLEAINDSIQLPQLYFATANLFTSQGDYDRAYDYADRALAIATDLNFKSIKANALLSRARPAAKLGNFPQALDDLRQALAIYETRRFGIYIGDCLHEMGWIFLNQNQNDSARYYFEKMMIVAKERKDSDHLFSASANLGHLSLAEQNPSTAIQYFNSAHQYAPDENYRKKEQIEMGLYEAYNMAGNPVLALVHLENQSRLKDSAYSLEKDKLFYDLEAKYNRTLQEKEITALSAENEISKIQLSSSRRWLITLSAGLLGVGLLLAKIFNSNKKIKEQNEVISTALKEKDTLLREIHHRVKNNLQFISSLLSLQSDHIQNDQALEALKEGQDRVQSMALIHQNLYQEDNLTGIELKDYLEKLIQNLIDSYNISPNKIKLDTDIQPLNLDVDTVVPLGLIINELVSNSLKYAFQGRDSGTIKVVIKEEGDELLLMVHDDGVGLQEGQLGDSFGYRLINAFKNQLDAQLDVDGRQGTRVKMAIKDYKKTG